MKCCVFLVLLCFSSIFAGAQQSAIDSLRKALAEAPADKKIDVYQAIIIKLWLNHPDSAMVYAQQAVEFSNSMDVRTKAIATRLTGGVYYYQDKYDSAIKSNYRALHFSEQASDSALIASAINNLGLAFYKLGSYPEALQYLLRALNLKIRVKQNYGMVQTLNNVGLVYNALKEYDKARDFYQRAIDLSRELKDYDGLVYSLNNFAVTFLNEKKTDEAEPYFKEAQRVGLQIENAVWESATYNGLGRIALTRNKIKDAKHYFNESLRMRESIHEWSGISEVYFYYGQIHEQTGRLDSALYDLRKSTRLARQIGLRDRVVANYKTMTELFGKIKKYDSAFLYQSRFIALRDTLYDENLARNVNAIQLQAQAEEASSKLREKDREIDSQTTQIYFITAIGAVVLIAAIGFYRSSTRERKLKDDLAQEKEKVDQQKEELQLSNEQLANAHEIISRQNSELEEYNLQLQSTVDTRTRELELANRELNVVNLELDNFIYKSSHDIKGPLARLIGLCHVALLDVSDEKAKHYLLRLSENAKNLSEIFERLRTVSDINSIELTREKISFGEMIGRVKDRLKNLQGYDEITFKEDIDSLEFQSDPVLVETIFHNLIENAVKFQKKSDQFNKFISIKVKRQNGSVRVSFIDNGIGIRKTDDQELFSMFTNAALEHKTIGLGLYIVKQCTAKLNGTVRIVPNPNQYTEFELTLPLEQVS
ncbi:MAG TPA: tetratricopeptide repeat-containing sensor histidine kinase [Cyclobacteriaceae bacterium]|jgi:signal transduction histidine kinase/Tfp pilus assembly protein PilF|nr:tetratricopeptide repeat-containing sensor histidine kinase [Cyclobacteriaceae bacterium]